MTGARTAARLLTSHPRVLGGENPFNVPREYDLLRPVQPSVPNYSETMYFGICDRHQSGLGLFLHTGRIAEDLDLWWARTIAYLPGGEVLVARTFGRAPDTRGPATGNLAIRCVQEHMQWALTFDGAGELTTRDATGRDLVGSGAPTPMRFDVDCTAISPVWDLEAACGLDEDIDGSTAVWAARHHQQGFLARGTVQVGGRRWDLDGVAYRDHSWGPRDLSDFGGDAFVAVVFPESRRVVSGMVIWNGDGEINCRTLYISEPGRLELFSDGDVPRAEDALSNPRSRLRLALRRQTGEELTLTGEVLNGVTTTVLDPNRNLNGAALGRADALLLNEDMVRYVWPDGEVGYGHSERGLRGVEQ